MAAVGVKGLGRSWDTAVGYLLRLVCWFRVGGNQKALSLYTSKGPSALALAITTDSIG